ncbi:MAG: hypothetical protein ABSH37_22810, partial [Bryobacteraceae bacterium]
MLVPFMAAQVKIGGVLGHHALHVELGAQRGDGGFHARDPAARQAIGAALVKGRDDVVLEDLIQGQRFHLILIVLVVVLFAAADGPADERLVRGFRVPGFIPPAIQDAEVQSA